MDQSYWCEHAWLGGDGADAGVLVSCDGARIAAVEAGVGSPPAGAERLGGIVLPGFANAHSHAFHRVLRGRGEAGGGSFWTWRERMYEVAAGLDPDRYLRLARATFAEMALAGFTAVGEFHYLHHGPGGAPYDDRNEIGEALIEAAAARPGSGSRCSMPATCTAASASRSPAVQRRFSDGDAEGWAERVGELSDGPGVRIGAAIHSVRAVDPDAAADGGRVGGQRARPLHAHVSEQPAENEAASRAYGADADRGARRGRRARDRFTAVHATHLDDADIAAARRGAALLLPLPDDRARPGRRDRAGAGCVAAGAPLALGTRLPRASSICSRRRGRSSSTSGWPAASAAATARRRCCGRRRRAGTQHRLARGRARSSPGAPADLVDGRPRRRPARRRAARDALESVVFAAAAADVERVVVGGREIVRDGSHVAIDVASELRESIAAVRPMTTLVDRPDRPAGRPTIRSSARARSVCVRDAALVIEDGRVAAVERGRRRRPTCDSMPAGAA